MSSFCLAKEVLCFYHPLCFLVIQRFAAFLAPLTSGRVTIAVSAIYSSQVIGHKHGDN